MTPEFGEDVSTIMPKLAAQLRLGKGRDKRPKKNHLLEMAFRSRCPVRFVMGPSTTSSDDFKFMGEPSMDYHRECFRLLSGAEFCSPETLMSMVADDDPKKSNKMEEIATRESTVWKTNNNGCYADLVFEQIPKFEQKWLQLATKILKKRSLLSAVQLQALLRIEAAAELYIDSESQDELH